MYFILFLLLFCLFVFLFYIYALTHDDHVFLRKGVSIEQIFNGVFLGFLVGIFFSRLLYVLLNPTVKFLNPLVFLLFPYFPGLSLVGGVVGTIFFLYFYYSRKKMPTGRLFDFFAFSFLFTLPFGYLFSLISLLISKKINPLELIPFAIYLIVFILFWKLILPFQRRGEFKDGSLGFLTLVSFSLISLILDITSKTKKIFLVFGTEDFIFLGIIAVSIFIFNKQEKLVQKIKIFKKN